MVRSSEKGGPNRIWARDYGPPWVLGELGFFALYSLDLLIFDFLTHYSDEELSNKAMYFALSFKFPVFFHMKLKFCENLGPKIPVFFGFGFGSVAQSVLEFQK